MLYNFCRNDLFSKRRLLQLALMLSALAFLNSCAYFNTYYNTKKYYKEALKEHKNRRSEKPSSQEKQKFDKAITQASKVVQLYPNSKYVDDSIMIIGRSYYYLEEYRKAERKFEELREYFPNSAYAPEAKLWLAKTRIDLEKYREAEALLAEMAAGKQKRYRKQASFWIGESKIRQEKFEEALAQYDQALGSIDNNELEIQALMRLGECYTELGNFEKAAERLEKASKRAQKEDAKFQATLAYGKAVSKIGEYFHAKKILKDLVDKNFQYKEVYRAKLELAHVYLATGEDSKALELYNDIIDDHPRTSGAAGAYYALAKYDETAFFNYEAAEENYRNVRKQDAKNDLVEPAEKRALHLKRLVGLREEVRNFKKALVTLEEWHKKAQARTKLDTTAVAPDTTAVEDEPGGAAARSGTTRKSKVETIEVVLNEEELAAADEASKKASGQNQARFSERDQRFSNTNRNNQRNSNIRQDPRSQRNLTNPPNNRRSDANRRNSTSSRNQKPRKKTMKIRPGDADSLQSLVTQKNFEIAELFLFEFNAPDSALNLYLDVLTRSGKADERAFAFYSLAFIYDDKFPNEAVRDSIYQILTLNYPETKHGKKAALKLGLVVAQDSVVVGRAENPITNQAFEAAYDALFEREQAGEAVAQFERALEMPQPDSLKERILYTLGWIHEKKLHENDKALDYYSRLSNEYPRSNFTREIKPKVAFVERKRKAEADSLAKLQAAEADSLAGLQAAEAAKSDSLSAGALSPGDSLAAGDVSAPEDSSRSGKAREQPGKENSSEQDERIRKLLERKSAFQKADSLRNKPGLVQPRRRRPKSSVDSVKAEKDRKPAKKKKGKS